MRGLPGIVLGVSAALVVACSSGKRAAMEPVAPTANSAHGAAEPMVPPTQDPRGQIQWYSDQIEAQRKQIGMPEAVMQQMTAQPESSPPHAAQDNACHAGESESCHSVCTLSDSICDNADKICKISDDLGDDEWAAGKCTSARSTCTDAHKRCCTCS
ncbi:MAG: hypothetical protein JO257_36445 [Deltaproteobacteria bacterium]|nr:hypothetical protein [Deltaproteobacteria bacterium]